ncbi:MAG: hypothetical protein ABI478_12970 [Propionivibrio sp.]
MKSYQIVRAAKTFPNGVNLPLRSMVALALALHCPGLLAEEMKEAAAENAISAAQAEIPWMSGGVGEESRAAMRDAASAYNVHIVFSAGDGAYLASIPFSVERAGGPVILAGISNGPLLNLKLKPGAYRVMAEINDMKQSRNLRVGKQMLVRLHFVGRSR